MSPNTDLTLEKLEVVKRLSALETKTDLLLARLESHADSDTRLFKVITENLEKLNTITIGDGDKIGVLEEIRGMKEIEKNRRGHIKVFYVAIVGGFCDFIYRNIQHFFNHKG